MTSIRIPADPHIQSFRNKMAELGAFLLEVEKTATTKEPVAKPISCIDLKARGKHKRPYPYTRLQYALWADLKSRAEAGLTTRYSSFSDPEVNACIGYLPDVDIESTWLSDEDALEYSYVYKDHIRLLQLWQRMQLKLYRKHNPRKLVEL